MTRQDKDRCIWYCCTDTRQFREAPRVVSCSKGHYWKFDEDETVTPLRLIPLSKAAGKFKQLNKQERTEAHLMKRKDNTSKLVIAVFERLAIMGVMSDNDLFNFNGKKELISF